MRYWIIIRRKIFLFLFLISACFITVNSQINTASPYSRFGLGEAQKQGLVRGLSMGSTGIALRKNNQINYLNPASYTATDTLSFLFDFGLNTYTNSYKSNDSKLSMSNSNLHHLALSFPVTRWWKSAAGVVPYTSVGYNIKESITLAGIGNVDNFYEGNGGLNRFFLGNAINLFNKLDIGFNLNYIFGYINYSRSLRIISDNAAAVPRSENHMSIGDLMYQFGLQYTETINDKYFFTLGVSYESETSLKAKGSFTNELIFPGQTAQINDSVFVSPFFNIRNESLTGNVTYPAGYGFGLSFGITDMLTLTGDYYIQNWSNATIMGRSDSLVNSGSFHFGAEYIPSMSSLRSYFSRINYRLGGYHTNSYISIRGEQIKDYGITFGIGLPFRSTNTSFNIGGIVGQRGTLENDLIRENYGILHFGVTFHDIWFRKRKFE